MAWAWTETQAVSTEDRPKVPQAFKPPVDAKVREDPRHPHNASKPGGRAEADRWVKSLGNIIDRNNLEISLLVELATSGSIKVCSGGIPASRHSPRRRRTACLRGWLWQLRRNSHASVDRANPKGQRLPEISILVGVTSLEVNTVIIGPHVLHANVALHSTLAATLVGAPYVHGAMPGAQLRMCGGSAAEARRHCEFRPYDGWPAGARRTDDARAADARLCRIAAAHPSRIRRQSAVQPPSILSRRRLVVLIADGARLPAVIDRGLGDWPHGASRTRNLHFLERTLLPGMPPSACALLRFQAGPHAGACLTDKYG
eukprot:s7338_g3.t1